MEKLQILKTPEDRQRRLKEIPEIHSDPKMDPSYESDDRYDETEDSRQGFLHNQFVYLARSIVYIIYMV